MTTPVRITEFVRFPFEVKRRLRIWMKQTAFSLFNCLHPARGFITMVVWESDIEISKQIQPIEESGFTDGFIKT